jgi:hypothetical protein
MIALLCPTRGRPEQCKRMIESAYATSKFQLMVLLAQPDSSHVERVAYFHAVDAIQIGGSYTIPDMMPTAHKWNILAREAMKDSSNKLFMLAADDMVFTTPGFDKALIDHYQALPDGKKAHVYALQDSRDEAGTPHPIFTREWIELFGYMVNPMFLHFYVDTWAVEVAKSCGAFTYLKNYGLSHIKPSDEGKPDATHSRIREWGWNSRDKFVWDSCQNYLELDKQKLAKALNVDYPREA